MISRIFHPQFKVHERRFVKRAHSDEQRVIHALGMVDAQIAHGDFGIVSDFFHHQFPKKLMLFSQTGGAMGGNGGEIPKAAKFFNLHRFLPRPYADRPGHRREHYRIFRD